MFNLSKKNKREHAFSMKLLIKMLFQDDSDYICGVGEYEYLE
jgi:hypothetical protein